ncbi:MAG: hypothetical protein IJL69_05300, partial [Oscillospiraceae bacterium]|nr:hypothetical protein [Oscillospiraceae bacterium]
GDFGLPDYSFRVDVVSEEDNSTLLYSAEQGEELFDAATAEPTEEEKLAAYIETATAELAKKVNVVSVEAQDNTVVATISVDGAADMVAKTRAGDGMGKLKWDGLRGDLLVGSTQYYSALVGDFGLPDYSFRVDVVSEEDNSVLLYSAEQGIALYDLALMPEDAEECAKLANYLTVARGELLKEKILTSVAVLPDAEDGKVVVATITVDGAVDMVDKVKAGDGGAKLKWDGLRGDIAQASVGYYSALIGDFGLPDYSFRVDVVSDADRSVVLYSVLNGEAVYDITAE